MNRNIPYIAVLITIGVLIVCWLWLQSGGDVEESWQDGSVETRTDSVTVVAETLPEDSLQREHMEGTVASDDVEGGSLAGEASIRVRFMISDHRGVATSDLEGTATLALLKDRDVERFEIAVHGGEGVLEVGPDFDKVILVSARFNGQWAQRQDEATLLPPRPWDAGTAIELQSVWLLTFVVNVLDARGRFHLTNIMVAKSRHQHFVHPGKGHLRTDLVEGGSSPLRVPRADPPRISTELWFKAPGYAWKFVRIDHERTLPITVHLDPGGSLEVSLSEPAPDSDYRLRLYAPLDKSFGFDDEQRALVPEETGALFRYPIGELDPPEVGQFALFDALPPGGYVVRLDRMSFPLRITDIAGSAYADVIAGEKHLVRIAIRGPPLRPARVTASGMLMVPNGWPRELLAGIGLTFSPGPQLKNWQEERLNIRLEAVEEFPGTYKWEKELYVGVYDAIVRPMNWRCRVEVPEGGLSDLLITLPPPAEVAVTVVDQDTGETIDVRDLQWYWPSPLGTGLAITRSARRAENEQVFHFLAPAGTINLFTFGGDMGMHPFEVTLTPGPNRIEVPYRRSCGVHVLLRESGEPLFWSDEFGVRLERNDGGDAVSSFRGGRVHASGPGTYTLMLQVPEWCELVPPRLVTIPAGEFVDVTVEITYQ